MGLNESVCLQNALEILQGGTVSLEMPPPPQCWQPPPQSPPRDMKQVHCLGGQFRLSSREADKVAVLVIIEPTDMWETARWVEAVIETSSRQTNGWVWRLYGIRHFLYTCWYKDQTFHYIYFKCATPIFLWVGVLLANVWPTITWRPAEIYAVDTYALCNGAGFWSCVGGL